MNIIKEEQLDFEGLVNRLKAGDTIVYPTETCYGLGCAADNDEAVERIFAIKRRQKDKPLLVLAHDPAVMMRYVHWTPALEKLNERYWPGPLTVVAGILPHAQLARGVIASDRTVAFRITDHPLCAALSEALHAPLVSTSANIAAHESPYDIADILATYAGAEQQPDIVIDAGILPHHAPSTVVRLHNGEIEVIRQGELIVTV